MNTSSGYHAAVGGKVKLKKHTGGKKPAAKSAPNPKSISGGAQQSFPGMWLSAYGKRRKQKMRGI